MESEQKKPWNYLAIGEFSAVYIWTNSSLNTRSDGGCSALPALHITEEMSARLQYDLDSDEEVRVGDHCDILGGSGTGA
jgi:hypothetical protein